MNRESEIPVLAAAIRGQDPNAAAPFWERFHEQVMCFAQRWLNRHPALRRLYDADDLAQDAWCRFFEKVLDGRFAPRSSQEAALFLRRSTRDAARDARRREHRARREIVRSESMDAARTAVDGNRGPDYIAEVQELIAWALRRLSAQDRRIVQDWMSGLTWSEVGDRESATADAVRKRFLRALGRITACADAGAPPELMQSSRCERDSRDSLSVSARQWPYRE